jgi:UDP-glucose 4-epimerase
MRRTMATEATLPQRNPAVETITVDHAADALRDRLLIEGAFGVVECAARVEWCSARARWPSTLARVLPSAHWLAVRPGQTEGAEHMSRSLGVRRQFGMSQIVVTGSTGVIGRRAVRELLAAGHRVTGVTRSPRGRARLESLRAGAVEADVFDAASLRDAFASADVVMNLLTHIPSAERMADPSAWAENDRLRTEASAAVARAARDAGVRRLVQESIAFVYADGGDAWLDEDAPVAGGGVTATALTAERNARELFDGDAVVLRFGLFMGPDSGSMRAALDAARGGASIAFGPPGAYRPTVWLDDAAAAIVAALGVPAGTYNVADADPATNAEIDAAVAAAVGTGALHPRAPQDGPLARSQRVSSRRLRDASGWAPRLRAATEAWGRIAA